MVWIAQCALVPAPHGGTPAPPPCMEAPTGPAAPHPATILLGMIHRQHVRRRDATGPRMPAILIGTRTNAAKRLDDSSLRRRPRAPLKRRPTRRRAKWPLRRRATPTTPVPSTTAQRLALEMVPPCTRRTPCAPTIESRRVVPPGAAESAFRAERAPLKPRKRPLLGARRHGTQGRLAYEPPESTPGGGPAAASGRTSAAARRPRGDGPGGRSGRGSRSLRSLLRPRSARA